MSSHKNTGTGSFPDGMRLIGFATVMSFLLLQAVVPALSVAGVRMQTGDETFGLERKRSPAATLPGHEYAPEGGAAGSRPGLDGQDGSWVLPWGVVPEIEVPWWPGCMRPPHTPGGNRPGHRPGGVRPGHRPENGHSGHKPGFKPRSGRQGGQAPVSLSQAVTATRRFHPRYAEISTTEIPMKVRHTTAYQSAAYTPPVFGGGPSAPLGARPGGIGAPVSPPISSGITGRLPGAVVPTAPGFKDTGPKGAPQRTIYPGMRPPLPGSTPQPIYPGEKPYHPGNRR